MIQFGSVGSVHSNLPPKSELNIFDFKNSKPNPNRTKTKPKIWQQFGRFQSIFSIHWFFAHPYRLPSMLNFLNKNPTAFHLIFMAEILQCFAISAS